MRRIFSKLLLIFCFQTFAIYLFAQKYEFSTQPTWSDEFNYRGFPDPTKWRIDIDKNPKGRGTHYVKSKRNVWVANGKLCLTITKDDEIIHSGRIQSTNIAVEYGRLDIRAKCPVTNGVWPALYLRGTNRHPYFGEIDILEYWGKYNSNYLQTNYHVWGTFGGKKRNHIMHPKKIACDVSKYHVYSYINLPDSSLVQIDGKTVYTITKKDEPSWPFHEASDIIFALAYIGNSQDDVKLPQTLKVDWVRYYRLKND
jgi:beta-glucanase (GH16 family)